MLSWSGQGEAEWALAKYQRPKIWRKKVSTKSYLRSHGFFLALPSWRPGQNNVDQIPNKSIWAKF